MSHRLTTLDLTSSPPPPWWTTFPISTAIRRTFKAGYDRTKLRADLLAGSVVGIVALPLSMALAISVGVAPQHGLYTAIVAGAIVALTGGSKFQVTGPTAAFIVVLSPILSKHGLSGLLTAGLMAGILLIAMGVARFGKLIQFIPYPVTTGFTAGIATVIATLQIKDVFALPVAKMPETYVEKIEAMWRVHASASFSDFAIASGTLALLILLPRKIPQLTRRVPGPLIAIALVSIIAVLIHHFVPSFDVVTIGSRFRTVIDGKTIAGIPPLPPLPVVPWGEADLSLSFFRSLLPAAFAIAMLGAIESLLSAVIADGMTGKTHDPDAELIGLGLGNIFAAFFGGIAATGALARTATNVRSGAQSPIAAVAHAIVVLLAILLLAPLIAFVPMSALAGLLLLVAWNMSEVRHFLHTLKVAPKSDIIVLLTCFFLTVVFDMVIAVSFGVILASLLFMKRMSELTKSRLLEQPKPESSWIVPEDVAVYEIAGPLFFGAAQNAMGTIAIAGGKAKIVVLSLGLVPAIDATGLVALESALERLNRAKKQVIIAGPLPEPRAVFDRAKLSEHHKHLTVVDDLPKALALVNELLANKSTTGTEDTILSSR